MKIRLGQNKIGVKLGNGNIFFRNILNTSQEDTTAPSIISGPTASLITQSSFRVTWSLDEGSTGQVEYGTTPSYGSFTTLEPNYLTTHIQTLSGLLPNTLYYFRVLGQDAAGNSFVGAQQTSTTLASTLTATIIATDATATEESVPTSGFFTISLSQTNNTGSPITINYSISGTAINGVDYEPISSSVTIPNGQISSTVTILPVDDMLVEGNETVTLTLTTGSGYVVGSPSTATLTITDNENTGGTGNPNYFQSSPTTVPPNIFTTYVPTSAGDLSNPANANKIAIISNSFSATGVTLASGQIIRPAGGSISGTNINLNGAYIEEIADQAFSSSVTFNSIYEDSWVYPELFGATANGVADDNAAIEACIKNTRFCKNTLNGTYVKNDSNFIDRNGQFIWDLNGSTVSITNNSAFNQSADQQALFWLLNISTKIFNGTINGNNLFGRAFIIAAPEAYHFENLIIENFAAILPMRGVALQIPIYNSIGHSYNRGEPWGTNYTIDTIFQNGYMNNCIIRNISSEGNCSFNDTQGVTKGWWIQYEEIDPLSPATIYHSNNHITNILGEDAEGGYIDDGTFGGGNRVNEHLINFTMYNDVIEQCNRRSLKITQSNVTLDSCTFRKARNNIATQSLATTVDFFVFLEESYINDYNTNVNILNCTFEEPEDLASADTNSGCGGSIPDVALLNMSNVYNAVVRNNTFSMADGDNFSAVRIGSSGSEGKLRNCLFENNVFTNAGYQFLPAFKSGGTTNIIRNEIINIDITTTGGASNAAFRFTGTAASDTVSDIQIDNVTINITGDNSGWKGMLYSKGAAISNWNVSNVTINYPNGYSAPAFADFEGSIDNTNIFDNIRIVGAPGVDQFIITGAIKTPVIINSFGDNNSPLTVVGNSYTPTTVADLTNAANAGKTAIITNSFNLTNTTIAANQVLTPNGGIISGTNINLNGSYINNTFEPIFANNVTFSQIYNKTRLSPESFSAVGNGITNDNIAINTLINQCQLAIGNPVSTYIKNNPTNYTRSGLFDWNMNGCSVEVTSSANFNLTQVSVDHVFDFTNTSVKFTNGIFDLNNVYGRLFYFHGQPTIEFDNCTVRNLYSPNANFIRAIAFRHSIDSTASGFISATYTNNTIHDVVCQGDGNYNDGGGISKAWWYTMSGATASTDYSVIHQNNTVYNIIGDDAEAFYAIQGSGTLSHNGTWLFDNENYYNCTRRAMKFCVSNVTVQNCFLEEIDDIYFSSAQQMGSMVDFFSTQSVNKIENLVVNNNTIKGRDGQDTHYHLLSFTDAQDITVTNNTIQMDVVENYAGLRLGSETSFYAGYLSNLTASGNTFINCGVQLLGQYAPSGQLIVTNNSFTYNNFTENWGSNQAALRTTSTTGTRGNVNFTFNNIVINVPSSTSLFNGLIYSQGSEYVNMLIDNCTVTYQNATITRPFGYIQGNFGNTNTISNCTIAGDIGTEALVITGATQNPVITNSFGDGATPLTVQ